MQEKVLLIVPCYNEANRLDFGEFSNAPDNCHILYVNDGSKDNTAEVINKNLDNRSYLLDLKQNGGKAEAVRQGMLHCRTMDIFEEIYWVGYWDADLATPLNEVNNFLDYRDRFYPKAEVIIGSRIYRLGSRISRSFGRHLLGRLFATAVSLLFKLDCYDSQCGAKLFKKELLPLIATEPFISRWIFDIEIFLRLKNHTIVEYPLMQWIDVAGSKLNVTSTAFSVWSDLMRIKNKY